MRKIKFRAKTINSNEWVYGYYAQGGNDNELKGVIMPQGQSVSELYEVKPETVCQLLCVKNGIEFYTGDILKGKQTFEKSSIYPLVYIEWNDVILSYELVKINGSVNPPLNWLSEYEKVGNLIDNPELLGGR
jgi:hypothetical protein